MAFAASAVGLYTFPQLGVHGPIPLGPAPGHRVRWFNPTGFPQIAQSLMQWLRLSQALKFPFGIDDASVDHCMTTRPDFFEKHTSTLLNRRT